MLLHVSSTCAHHQEVKTALHKLIVKQKFCASSWLITEINILKREGAANSFSGTQGAT